MWCYHCSKDAPAGKNRAIAMAPKRELPYQLNDDGLTINNKIVGICEKCKAKLNPFQRAYIIDYVDYGDKRLVLVNL